MISGTGRYAINGKKSLTIMFSDYIIKKLREKQEGGVEHGSS